jgi:uncharacterized protein (DUF2267 family)
MNRDCLIVLSGRGRRPAVAATVVGMDYDRFLDLVAERADVSREVAERLALATLRTLGERISGGEARDLAAQLPTRLASPLMPAEEEAEAFSLDEFIRRVAERAGTDRHTANIGVAAVLTTLRDAVTSGEFDDVMSQLPLEFRELSPGPRL